MRGSGIGSRSRAVDFPKGHPAMAVRQGSKEVMVRTSKKQSKRWMVVVGLFLLIGCAQVNPAQKDAGDILTPFSLTQTAYIQMLRARQTATVRTILPTPTTTSTPTPLPPATSTFTATPTPLPPSPSPVAVPATVQGNLYCRQGPGPYYRAITLLKPGQQVQVIGRHPVYYAYRLVALPSGTTCWAWARWLRIQGPEDTLPRVTPPPPPPGAFALPRQYPTMSPFCPAFFSPALLVQVKNLTSAPLRSMDVYIEVLDTGAIYHTYTPEGVPTCAKVRTQLPGYERATLAFRTLVDLTDKRVRLSIKACTKPHFQGTCVSYAVVWTIEAPPQVPFPIPFPGQGP